jgi:hypothetical protein
MQLRTTSSGTDVDFVLAKNPLAQRGLAMQLRTTCSGTDVDFVLVEIALAQSTAH